MFGYRRRLHKVKRDITKSLDTPKKRRSRGCIEKPIHDLEHRVNPVHLSAREIKFKLGIDTTDAVKAVNDLKKALHERDSNQADITDLHTDEITAGTIDAESIGIQNAVPRLKIIIDDVNDKPRVYLHGQQVPVESINVNYLASNECVSRLNWQVEYRDNQRQSISTEGESNETRRDRGMRP